MALVLMDTCMTLSRKGPRRKGEGTIHGGLVLMDTSMTLYDEEQDRHSIIRLSFYSMLESNSKSVTETLAE